MIPVKLRLRNFMCYRDGVPELRLEGLHVALPVRGERRG